jgi:hypothetical protein
MAEYAEKGLSLRWDAPDLVAPASKGPGTRLVVAARPPHPSNVVTVAYTVDGGATRLARGYRLQRAPRPDGEEWFAVDLPTQADHALLAFAPILSCSGREADPRRGGFSFTPAPPPHNPPVPGPENPGAQARRIVPSHPAPFPFEPKFLFRVTAPVHRDKYPVGVTPDGLRLTFLLRGGGYVRGPALTGEIEHRGGDWMRIRPDGVGIADIQALIRPVDGGIVLTEYSGVVDFGPDGYGMLAAGGGPKRAPLRFAPRYLTSEPRLSWLNRLQCFSVGEVNLERYLVEYDLYCLPSTTVGED